MEIMKTGFSVKSQIPESSDASFNDSDAGSSDIALLQSKFQSADQLSVADLPTAFSAESSAGNTSVITATVAAASESNQPRHCPDCRSLLKKKQRICPRCQLRLLVETRITKNLITRDEWQNLLARNSLPGDIKQLSAKQAHTARLKLDEFLKRRKLVRRLGLNFVFETVSAAAADNKEAMREEFISAAVAALSNTLNNADASARHVSPSKYREVVLRQGLRCYWCWQAVVRVSEIPASD